MKIKIKNHHQGQGQDQGQGGGSGYLPKTMTARTTATASTSRSFYSSTSSFHCEPKDLCPVTGVYANVHDDYLILPPVIGKGHYGIVRECLHRNTQHRLLAVKTIDKSRIGRLDHLRREIFLLASVDHPRVMKMLDCYEDERDIHIITERYAGGELFDTVLERTSRGCSFSEYEASKVIKSLLEAVAYLHENGLVHRDIKPENILFEFESSASNKKNKQDCSAIKLIDFGLARRHDETKDSPMANPVGTSYYMSPELLLGKYTNACDIWSVGVVAYILLSGYPPFNGENDDEIQECTLKGKLRFLGSLWVGKSDEAMDFCRCLLRKDGRRRCSAREALLHPWIRKMSQ
jgi:serine/threonine protein kinase